MSSEITYVLDKEDLLIAFNVGEEVAQLGKRMEEVTDLHKLVHLMDEISQTITTFGLHLSDEYFDELNEVRAMQLGGPIQLEVSDDPIPPTTPSDPIPPMVA